MQWSLSDLTTGMHPLQAYPEPDLEVSAGTKCSNVPADLNAYVGTHSATAVPAALVAGWILNLVQL